MAINSYADASDYLGRKADRPLTGRATRIIRRDASSIAIRYQSTDVVTYHADGTITLQNGGWNTVTTRARFREYTRARVWTSKGECYVSMGFETAPSLFYDGMRIDAEGKPLEPRYPSLSDRQRKTELDRKVREYVKGFADHVTAGLLENPGNGDCFGCLFQAEGASEPAQGAFRVQGKPTPHGRVEPLGTDHYLSHMDEGYFVPSLLFNAIKAKGYRDPAFIWHMLTSQKDGKWAATILRGYFRDLKPTLLEGIR
jgi:hypothetical protein